MIDWSHTGEQPSIIVNVPDRAALLKDVEYLMGAGKGFSIATLNLDHVVKIRRLPAFRQAYARHTHVTADGNPIVWLCRLAGQDVSLVPGSDLVAPVAAAAARTGAPVAFLGSTEASLERAAEALVHQTPGLRVVTSIAPPMKFDPEGPEADACIEALEASGARLCYLALGAPKQEVFAARAQDRLPGVGFLSIGAGLDFISGTQKRAPAPVRLLALEWLWRLGGNPRRLMGRYAACFAVLPQLARSALQSRRDARTLTDET